MAVKDIASNLESTVAFSGVFVANDTLPGAVIDTANFELGLMFALNLVVYATGDYTVELYESDVDTITAAGSGTQIVNGSDKLIGSLPTAIDTVDAEGDILPKFGVISNLRFVRVDVIGADTADATVSMVATQKAENMPV